MIFQGLIINLKIYKIMALARLLPEWVGADLVDGLIVVEFPLDPLHPEWTAPYKPYKIKLTDWIGVDNVVKVADLSALPGTGDTEKLYITIDNNNVYTWNPGTLAYGLLSAYDLDAIHLTQPNEFLSIPEKTTIEDDDIFILEDSYSFPFPGAKAFISGANLKASIPVPESFTELTDTFADYTDKELQLLRVNAAGTGIEPILFALENLSNVGGEESVMSDTDYLLKKVGNVWKTISYKNEKQVVSCVIVGDTPLAPDWLATLGDEGELIPSTEKIYIILTAGSYANTQYRWDGSAYVSVGGYYPLEVNLSVLDTNLIAANGVAKFPCPENMTILSCFVQVTQTGTDSSAQWDINVEGSSILTNKIIIETGEYSSLDATTQPSFSTVNVDKGQDFVIDRDSVWATGAGQNDVLTIIYQKR